MTTWTNQCGQPITPEMQQAACAIALEHGFSVSDDQSRKVLDIGLPYSMKSVPAAAKAAGIEEWVADLMLDSAIAAIE